MNLKSIIDEIADQADDFLEGVTSLEQARAAISEMVTMQPERLGPADRAAVIEGVMAILKNEGFFERGSLSGRSERDDEADQD